MSITLNSTSRFSIIDLNFLTLLLELYFELYI